MHGPRHLATRDPPPAIIARVMNDTPASVLKRITVATGSVSILAPAPLRLYGGVWLSPDRRRVATRVDDNGRSDLWVYDFGQDVLTPISRDGRSRGMIWGPTADRVTIVRDQEAGGADLYGLFRRGRAG